MSRPKGSLNKATLARRQEAEKLAAYTNANIPGNPNSVMPAYLNNGAMQPPPKLNNAALFRELGTSGLTRFGGTVYEEFLQELRLKGQFYVYREMRDNSPVVNATLYAIEMALRKVKFYFETENDKETELRDFLNGCLDDMSLTFQDTLSQICTMLQFGFSIFEIVYKVRKGPDGKTESRFNDGRIGWRKWLPLAQETLAPGREWIWDETGGIQGINQLAPPDYILRTLPIEKLLLFRPSVYKNNPEGRSILRAMYTSYYFAKNFQEIEGISLERMGAGIPVMYMGRDTVKAGPSSDIELAKQIVRDVRADEQQGVVIPYPKMSSDGNGMLFELLATPGHSVIDFNSVIVRYEQRMAMSALAQFIMLGMNGVGSYALSKDHSDLFILALSAWAEVIAETITRHALPRLLKLNTFTYDQMPELKHSELASPDLAQLASYINTLVGSQLIIPDSNLENYLREAAHLPEKQADAPTIDDLRKQKEEQAKQMQAQMMQGGTQDGEEEDPGNKKPGPGKPFPGKPVPGKEKPTQDKEKASILELGRREEEHFNLERFHRPGGIDHDQSTHAGGASQDKEKKRPDDPGRFSRVINLDDGRAVKVYTQPNGDDLNEAMNSAASQGRIAVGLYNVDEKTIILADKMRYHAELLDSMNLDTDDNDHVHFYAGNKKGYQEYFFDESYAAATDHDPVEGWYVDKEVSANNIGDAIRKLKELGAGTDARVHITNEQSSRVTPHKGDPIENYSVDKFHRPGGKDHDQSTHGHGGGAGREEKPGRKILGELETKLEDKYGTLDQVSLVKKIEMAKDLSDAFGIGEQDSAGILISLAYKPFTVEGEEFVTAGDFNPTTKLVTLYPPAFDMGYKNLVGVVAHESEHKKFDLVRNLYEKEDRASWDESTHSWPDRKLNARRADGDVNPAFADKYPTLAKLAKHLEWTTELAKDDGVTNYSKKWWEQWSAGRNTRDKYHPIDETLSEMAKIEMAWGRDMMEKQASPRFVELYDAVNEVYDANRK